MKYIYSLLFCIALFNLRVDLKAEENNNTTSGEYEFNEDETEKKLFEFGGYIEILPSISIVDGETSLYRLKYYKDDPGRYLNDAAAKIQPEVSFEKGIFKAFVRANGSSIYSNNQWSNEIKLYEGYGTLMLSENIIFDAGKKTLKWGKGYAWNPVAFVDRPKSPDDPELAYEGFTVASADFIVNFNGPLKTISLTPVIIPVDEKLNDEFGKDRGWNYAGRLYMLFLDTDIDLLFLKGESRGDKFGADFSRNLTTSFEIHGEYAIMPDYVKRYLDDTGVLQENKYNAVSYLAGIRYLTERETTFIVEYFHNGTGMLQSEMQNYYEFIDNAENIYQTSGNEMLIEKASDITEGNYGRANPMRDYVYLRISRKEPFDILYFTPAVNFISNLNDKSFSVTPEVLYSGINNFEIRLRYTLLSGDELSEYGEKPVNHKFDMRLRYYF